MVDITDEVKDSMKKGAISSLAGTGACTVTAQIGEFIATRALKLSATQYTVPLFVIAFCADVLTTIIVKTYLDRDSEEVTMHSVALEA